MKINIAIPILLLALACCKPVSHKSYIRLNGFTQGTTYSITYYDSLYRDFSTQIDSILNRIDYSMSIYNSESIISKVNSNQIDTIDTLLKEVIEASFNNYHLTDGAFDITVGPIVRAIGFGPDKSKGIDSAKIKTFLPLIGMNQLMLNGYRLIKANKNIQIDVNAIAQGYTADVVGEFFKSKGVANYLVEVGGEITADGVNPSNKDWVIGIDRPMEGALPGENLQAKVTIGQGEGLATSGNYRKFIEVNGQKYSHTINPKTGFPELNNLLSATVIAPSASKADALATAFMVKGLDWTKEFVERNKDINVYLIYAGNKGEYRIWMDEGMKKKVIP